MNARVSKRRTRSSRVKLSKARQEKLLDAVVREGEGHLSRSRQQSAVRGDLASPEHSRKRPVDATLKITPAPARAARLTQTNLRQLIEVEKAEQAAKTLSQQPKPLPLKRPHASFLEDCVDQLPSSPALKRYRPESVDSFVTQWLESDRERHCRSDTFLCHSDRDLIPRRRTKSASNMEDPRDVDGFVRPPTPASTRSRLYGQSFVPFSVASSTGSGRSSGTRLIEDPNYREMNLAANNIYLRPLHEQFPQDIASLIDHVGRDRDSPGPSLDQIRHDAGLNDLWMGSAEPNVEKYFQTNIFPDPEPSSSLKRTDRLSMAKRTVPDFGSHYKVSTPMPDMLYGYSRNGAFPEQQTQLLSMGTEMVANSQSLIYPFFVIEFKADGPSGPGSLWVATNQCLGGSATCVDIAERLNHRLRQCKNKEVQPINSAAFSVAMSGTEARLYISWKHDELISYMASVNSFMLQRPDHYVEFRKYVLNIIDWGKDEHLKDIRRSLDSLLEESKRKSSEAAKSRQSPSDDSAGSSRKRRASSGKGKPLTNSSKGKAKGSSSSAYDSNP